MGVARGCPRRGTRVTADRDLERSIERLTEAMSEYAFARVKQALALERDRMDAEVAELRDEVLTLGRQSERLAKLYAEHYRHWHEPAEIDAMLHSVKVRDEREAQMNAMDEQ
jgi:hypothetical protein